ncbi:MAG: efflux RND transporter periplasmic adaptor subunit [Deltaproteobacteria bacterium]|nr:efflux RND transporter periplasmic adaptor subunit [Deltaproteobacteria bacterium]
MKDAENPNTVVLPSLNVLLSAEIEKPYWRRRNWLLAALSAIFGLGIAALVSQAGGRAAVTRFQTEEAVIGELVVTVSATGTLQPTNKVELSSELSGIVAAVLVDENDRVKKGQVLARLDHSKLRDVVNKSRSTLAAAEAQMLQAQATVAETAAALTRLRQLVEISGGLGTSQSELETAEANWKRAGANEASARAGVSQARANLQSAETDLGKADIKSPIDGVVLARTVEPGQTVAATFQAPVLFTLAEDLTKMKLQVDIDEADVGQVKEGQNATFAVDAWPGRKYSGVITRVGYGSRTVDDVVTYSAVLAVSNDDLSLRPGMTATTDIVTVTRENVLLIPNAALRYTPPATVPASADRSGGFVGKLMPRPPDQPSRASVAATDGVPRVWVSRDGQAVPIEIQTGADNGRVTEVLGGSLKAGEQVITETIGTAS